MLSDSTHSREIVPVVAIILSMMIDGEHFTEIPVRLDAKILSDDYVNQRYGGFFTGAFVGLACVDLSGYDAQAEFDYFDYRELSDNQ